MSNHKMIAPEEEYRYKAVAYNVATLRDERGWTQQELADESNVERAKISRIENYKEDFLFSTILKLANAFKVPYDRVLDATVSIPSTFFTDKRKRRRRKK